MKILEAVEALKAGKVVNSSNAQATIKLGKKEGAERVEISRVRADKKADVMHMTLSRMQQLYGAHTFAEGQYKMTQPEKTAAK